MKTKTSPVIVILVLFVLPTLLLVKALVNIYQFLSNYFNLLRNGLPEVVQEVIELTMEPQEPQLRPIFVHSEHGTFTGTSLELRHQYGLHRGNMSELMNGKRSSVKGWSIG